MSRALDDLSLEFKPLAIELLARCTEAGISVLVVSTRRTPEECAANFASGVSWTKHSKHEVGNAIDIAPYDIYQLHGADRLKWDADDPTWLRIGKIGEALGLRWGGRWAQKDMGHFELIKALVPEQ
jgi:hypothetical protein